MGEDCICATPQTLSRAMSTPDCHTATEALQRLAQLALAKRPRPWHDALNQFDAPGVDVESAGEAGEAAFPVTVLARSWPGSGMQSSLCNSLVHVASACNTRQALEGHRELAPVPVSSWPGVSKTKIKCLTNLATPCETRGLSLLRSIPEWKPERTVAHSSAPQHHV